MQRRGPGLSVVLSGRIFAFYPQHHGINKQAYTFHTYILRAIGSVNDQNSGYVSSKIQSGMTVYKQCPSTGKLSRRIMFEASMAHMSQTLLES